MDVFLLVEERAVMPHRATEVDPALPDSLETGSSITL